jgi:hypothetical protein
MLEYLLILFIILAIIGLSVYFFIDYNKHKDTNTKDFEEVDKDLVNEKETRLANLKYVVDQVNDTNKTMDDTYTKRFDTVETDLKKNIDNYTKFESGFGSIIQARGSTNVTIPVTQLSTLPATDVQLMKHVSFLGGATIKDLQVADAKAMKICGVKGDATDPRCIQFPNSDGDTYITNIVKDKSIVLDGPVKTKGGVNIYGNLGMYTDPTATTKALELTNGAGQTNVSTDNTVVVKSVTAPAMDIVKINKNSVEINATNIKLTGNVTINGFAAATVAPMVITNTNDTTTTPMSGVTENFCGALQNRENYSCKIGTATQNYFIDNGTKRPYKGGVAVNVPAANAFPQECSAVTDLNLCPTGTDMP